VEIHTSLDLPDDLLKRSKLEAAERGISLEDLVTQALVKEVRRSSVRPAPGHRTRFPIFSSRQPRSLDLRNADLAESENDEDRRRGAAPG